jgi:type VI secretion system protein ImpJ
VRPIEGHFPPMQRVLEVFLAVPAEREGSPVVANSTGPAAGMRFFTASRAVVDAAGGATDVPVAFAQRHVTVLFGTGVRDDFDAIKIAEIVRDAAGALAVRGSTSPHRAASGPRPWLMGRLRRAALPHGRQAAAPRRPAAAALGRLVEFTAADITRFLLLNAVNTFLPIVNHLIERSETPPEDAYLLLCQFRGQLSTFASDGDPTKLPKFFYTDLYTTFSGVIDEITRLLHITILDQFVRVPLESREDGLHFGRLDDEKLMRGATYVLTVRSNQPEQVAASEIPKLSKIASWSEIPAIVHSALPGVPIQVTLPPAARRFRPQSGTLYFLLNQSGQYWRNVSGERTIAIYLPAAVRPREHQAGAARDPQARGRPGITPAATGVPHRHGPNRRSHADVFNFLIQLRRLDANAQPPPETVLQRLRTLIDTMGKRAADLGFSREDVLEITYAIVALADEAAIYAGGNLRQFWMQRPLQLQYFNENVAGENFFARVMALRQDARRIDVVRVYYTCLVLGFQGSTGCAAARPSSRPSWISSRVTSPAPALRPGASLRARRPPGRRGALPLPRRPPGGGPRGRRGGHLAGALRRPAHLARAARSAPSSTASPSSFTERGRPTCSSTSSRSWSSRSPGRRRWSRTSFPHGFDIAIVVTVLTVLALVGLVLYRKYRARKAAREIEKALNAQADEHARTVRPEQQAEVRAMQAEVTRAIASLKSSKLGKSGAEALYALPWYVIIGPPGSGKTTALRNSGLQFPYASQSGGGVKGVGGTRNCEWWLTNEAVLLDTAGRYMTATTTATSGSPSSTCSARTAPRSRSTASSWR